MRIEYVNFLGRVHTGFTKLPKVSGLFLMRQEPPINCEPRPVRSPSLPLLKALDAHGLAGALVNLDDDAAGAGVVARGLETVRHAAQESLNDDLRFDADDGIVRAGHA